MSLLCSNYLSLHSAVSYMVGRVGNTVRVEGNTAVVCVGWSTQIENERCPGVV